MRDFYPEIEPYATEMLDVGDGQSLYVEQCGNPAGKPAVFLHGGPGAGLSPDHRRQFDPERYRIVLFDQRNAGRSTPSAGRDLADLTHNTTWDLVADVERIREHLGIERWLVFGGSWGSTLALAYAEAHPSRVTELVLRGIFALRTEELAWFYEGAAAGSWGARAVLPDAWADYAAPVPVEQREHMLAAYDRLLNSPDAQTRARAADAWCAWEQRAIHLLPRAERPDTPELATQRLGCARIENHYFLHHGWLREGQVIADARARLRRIPAVIVQGRYDLCCPARTAWDLYRAWPEAEFHIVEDASHAFDEAGIRDLLIAATDRFARGAGAR